MRTWLIAGRGLSRVANGCVILLVHPFRENLSDNVSRSPFHHRQTVTFRSIRQHIWVLGDEQLHETPKEFVEGREERDCSGSPLILFNHLRLAVYFPIEKAVCDECRCLVERIKRQSEFIQK